jgi:hypothetical protein
MAVKKKEYSMIFSLIRRLRGFLFFGGSMEVFGRYMV